MAIINQKSGYFGYTLDGTDGATAIDEHGRVDRVIFAITYPLQPNDIQFTVSKGAQDWAAQMGDGSLINLSDPVVLFQNRDNSIVQFTMEQAYASNSPCLLVYRSNTASFNIQQLPAPRPFVVNSVSGHFAFTVEGYGGDTFEEGQVNRLMATMPFPQQPAHVSFEISKDPSHWGARMGDGSIIPLRDPDVLYVNNENAVVLFKMDVPYPSNSPCVLVYRSSGAKYNVTVDAETDAFIPVQDIVNIPATAMAGSVINLAAAEFFPTNATQQGITWTVIDGEATIENRLLRLNRGGTVQIKAVVVDGKAQGSNFEKYFTITVNTNTVDVYADPQRNLEVTLGKITERIFIHGFSSNGEIYYQWYQNTVDSNTSGGTMIRNATEAEFAIPQDLNVGSHYFFCEVSSPGATAVRSRVCHVRVNYALNGVSIYPTTPTLTLTSERQLHFNPLPEGRDVPRTTWHSSNPNVVQVSETGQIKAIAVGSATISVVNVDTGENEGTLEITVPEFVSVSDITGVELDIVDNTPYTLNATVLPANADNKDILWSIIETNLSGEADATLDHGKLTLHNIGFVRLKAIVEHGLSPVSDYVKEFIINATRHYTPVSDISVNRREI